MHLAKAFSFKLQLFHRKCGIKTKLRINSCGYWYFVLFVVIILSKQMFVGSACMRMCG